MLTSRKARATFLASATLAVLAGALFACDRVYADPVQPGSATSGRTDSGLTSPRLPAVPCPDKETFENSPCVGPGNVCEYGPSPDPSCNPTYVCTSDDTYGLYFREQSRKTCVFTCPKDLKEIVDGAPCDISKYGDGGTGDEAEVQCSTPQGTCACTTGPDGAHAHPRRWVCRAAGEGCPIDRPKLGQICVGEHACDYGACAFKRGARMTCQDETWQIEAAPCK